MMDTHTCRTSDGASIGCICRRGQDHDESDFDRPVENDEEEKE